MCLLFFSMGIDWLLWHSISLLVTHDTHAQTHTRKRTKNQEGRYNAVLPPPSCEDVFFFLFPLSQTSWEGYSALCVQRHSFFIFTSFILSVSYSWGAMSKKRGWGWVFHLDKEGHRENSTTKVQGNREGKGEWERKRRSLLVLRSSVLAAVWRRMAGGCLGVERVPV